MADGTNSVNAAYLAKAVDFLRCIGIPCEYVEGVRGVLAHVEIRRGSLFVTPDCPVSNLLHDAGHLAIIPEQYRGLLSGDADFGIREMLDDMRGEEPDSPLYRAAIQTADPEATAWAWAAGLHLGIPHKMIIKDSEYAGDGAAIRVCLQHKVHAGINGMRFAGMCLGPRQPGGYPQMLRWTQPVIPPAHRNQNAP